MKNTRIGGIDTQHSNVRPRNGPRLRPVPLFTVPCVVVREGSRALFSYGTTQSTREERV